MQYFDKIQLAIFGAYNYWDNVQKDSFSRQLQGKKASDTKGKTSQIIGQLCFTNEKYVHWAHQLLQIDAQFFYETFFVKRYILKKEEMKELIALSKTDPNQVKDLIQKMKNILLTDSNSNTISLSISPIMNPYINPLICGLRVKETLYMRAKKA